MYNHVVPSSSNTPTSLSNNPFIDDPSHAQHRFPDIGTIERTVSLPAAATASGYGYYVGGSSPYAGYAYAQQQQLYPASMQQPQQTGYVYLQQPPSYYGTQQQPQQAWSQGQQPSSLNPNVTSMAYQNAYSQQQQQQGYSGYGSAGQYGVSGSAGYQVQGYAPQYSAQTQVQLNLSEFDPLSSQSNSSSGTSPAGTPHPRDYVRTHKQELEMWDSTSWKQALNTLDALRDAWDICKRQIELRMQPGPYYLGLSETTRLQDLHKVAVHNVDTVMASSAQMKEVQQGYRHSADFASRNRVRESLNAALRQLPDWPPPANSW